MISHLYRFRRLERLLDRGELQNQEIYFANPETLNDPMEGFRDIFWRGDQIVWRNLLRHYVLCLDYAFSLLLTCGEEHSFRWNEIPILNCMDTNVIPEHKAMQDEIDASFFQDDGIQSAIKAFSARALPIRRNELAFYLRTIHPFAICVVQRCYQQRGFTAGTPVDDHVVTTLKEAGARAATVIEHTKALESDNPNSEFQIDSFFASQQHLLSELDLINHYNETIDPRQNNKNFVFLNFPDEYVRKIEALVYPEWFTACFMRECRDSSVWGSYGANHTAACLKFKVKDVAGKPTLKLHRINGYGSNGPSYGYVDHPFSEITYENEHLPVDFFKSLGRFPIPELSRYWYADEAGNRSPLGDEIFSAGEEWRNKYWNAYEHAITRKLKAWAYEQEYRLTLSGMYTNFSEPKSRALSYDFNDLEGIIFGIKTPMERKLAICTIIEEKCRAAGRTDFKFYQAFYSRALGTIEHAEMGLLKFKT
jgi:Protein of unknown function (DUF2971)